jgi:hypothetical protein
MLLLRFADQKTPAMDKLYFYVRQMDGVVKTSRDLLNSLENHMHDIDPDITNIATKMMKYFLVSEV